MTDTIKLAQFWYRRISEGVILVSLTVLVLYAWNYFTNGAAFVDQSLFVSPTAAVLAGVSLVTAVVSCVWIPKKYPTGPSLLSYVALWCMTGTLITTTGGGESPFLALWVMSAIFAGIYGLYGLLPMAFAPVLYLSWQFYNGSLTSSEAITIVLAGELPIVLSYLALTIQASITHGPNRTYQQLASELSEVAGKAEVVINAITDGVIALNSQGNIQLINPAAQQLIGWGKHDALTLNYKSVLKLTDSKGADLVAANDPIVRALASNEAVSSDDLTLITNSGKKLLVSLVISPVGQPGSGVIVAFRDITKEKTEERQQAEFISTASHEMRTPVASIEGYLGLTLNPATAQIDAKARDYITKAHESAEHLGRLFSDLLDVSKADDGRLSNNPSVVDVVAFAQDVVQDLRAKADAKGLHMIFKPMPDDTPQEVTTRRLNPVFYVNVDNDHLREVLSNLVENAIKYTPHGTITIDVGGDSEHVVISIQDSGIGIPIEDQPHLFQKFYRVDSSDTREIGGTGLGLYLCRRLTETMQGRIWVESVYKQGSTFFVELPRTSHEEAMQLIEAAGEQDKAAQPQPPSSAPILTPPAQVIPPAPVAPIAADETAYISPSPEVVAAQLSATKPSPAPDTASLVGARPFLGGQPGNDPANPSLAAIEQYPDQYLQRPRNVVVPPRDQNQS